MTIIVPAHVLRAARALSGLNQAEVCARAGVSPKTMSDLETGRRTSLKAMVKVRKVYESEGIEFVATSVEGGFIDGCGVRQRPLFSTSGTCFVI